MVIQTNLYTCGDCGREFTFEPRYQRHVAKLDRKAQPFQYRVGQRDLWLDLRHTVVGDSFPVSIEGQLRNPFNHDNLYRLNIYGKVGSAMDIQKARYSNFSHLESLISREISYIDPRYKPSTIGISYNGSLPFEALTENQRNILELMSYGLTNKQIATKISSGENKEISWLTVRNETEQIYEKLEIPGGYDSRVLATRIFMEQTGNGNPHETLEQLQSLTDIELEILRHISYGLTSKQIAEEVINSKNRKLSPFTIRNLSIELFRKLELPKGDNARVLATAIYVSHFD